jgi:hypothetical protein
MAATGTRRAFFFRAQEGSMLWTIDRPIRPRPLRASQPRRVTLTAADAELLRYGAGYFGGLEAFNFRCPGPCSTLHEVRPRQRRRHFDPRAQRFHCPDCGIELQLSILAEILPPRLTRHGAADYEASVLDDMANRPPDTVPTVEQAATIRLNEEPE